MVLSGRGLAKARPRVHGQCKRRGIMAKYKCTVCGYIYDPAAGDPDNGVKPGTPFEKLPDSWVCPECGVGKDMFEKI